MTQIPVFFEPARVLIDPGALALLAADQLRGEVVGPGMAPAGGVDHHALAVDVQRLGHRVVMVVEAGIPHAGVFGDRVVSPDPCPGRPRAGIGGAEPAVEVAFEAGVGHAAVGAVLARLTLAIGAVDKAAIRAGPGLIVRWLPVLAALEEDNRLPPQRRAGRAVCFPERLHSAREAGASGSIRVGPVADAGVANIAGA